MDSSPAKYVYVCVCVCVCACMRVLVCVYSVKCVPHVGAGLSPTHFLSSPLTPATATLERNSVCQIHFEMAGVPDGGIFHTDIIKYQQYYNKAFALTWEVIAQHHFFCVE